MKLKANWGTRIFFLYIGFVGMIITFVLMAMNQKIDLVAPDYYAQEINYQQRLDAINRANAMRSPLSWNVGGENITLTFPEGKTTKETTGTIKFFRPSDKEKDMAIPIQLDETGKQLIAFSDLSTGMYRMQVEWISEGVQYYKEGVIVIR